MEATDLSCRSLQALPSSLLSSPPQPTSELILSFNQISSLAGLVPALPDLTRLTAAHNEIRSLPELHRLPRLCRVDLSSNQLREVSPLEQCPVLTELWLASNRLDLPAVLPLRTALSLRTLVLTKNPCERAQPPGVCCSAVLVSIPQLTSLDAQPIGPSERADAVGFFRRDACGRRALVELLGMTHALSLLRGPAPPTEARLASSRTSPPLSSHEDGRSSHGGSLSISQSSNKALSLRSGEECLLHAQHRLEESERVLSTAKEAYVAPQRQPARCGRRAQGRGPASKPLKLVASSVPSADDDFTIHYPSGSTCVLIRQDGSCTCRWPAGSVAVNVDRANGPYGFELRANFRRGGIAVVLDASGNGFAYRRTELDELNDGTLFLRRETLGEQLCTRFLDPNGVETDRWSSPIGCVPSGGARSCALYSDASKTERMAAMLGPELAIITHKCGSFWLALCADGIRHLIVHGPNAQQPTWDADDEFLSQIHGKPRAARSIKSTCGSAALSAACKSSVSQGLAGITDAVAMLPDLGQRKTYKSRYRDQLARSSSS